MNTVMNVGFLEMLGISIKVEQPVAFQGLLSSMELVQCFWVIAWLL
jgi:hypothetical protein